MDLARTSSHLARCVNLLFLAATVCVPFSTALTNVFGFLTLLSFIGLAIVDRSVLAHLRMWPAILSLALFGLLLLGSLWSIAPASEVGQALTKYLKLLFIPIGIGMAARDPQFAKRVLYSFLAGAVVLASASYLTKLGLMPESSHGWWSVGSKGNAFALKNHITLGILLAYSSLICLIYCSYTPSTMSKLIALSTSIFFAVPMLFFTWGRTGYIAFTIGLCALAVLRSRENLIRSFIYMTAAILVMAMVFGLSENMQTRAKEFSENMKNYSGGQELNPDGIRMSFMKGGATLFMEKPVLGHGTGAFQEGFAASAREIWPASHPFHSARHQPHSEIIQFAVQLGIVGLVLYMALLTSLSWHSWRQRQIHADALSLLVIMFGTCSVFNSLLWDFTEGFWFVLLSGSLYAAVHQGSMEVLPQIQFQPSST